MVRCCFCTIPFKGTCTDIASRKRDSSVIIFDRFGALAHFRIALAGESHLAFDDILNVSLSLWQGLLQ
jgi:hypothetical protein